MKFLTCTVIMACNLGVADIVSTTVDSDQILQSCPEVILFQTDDRIYLMPEEIRATEQGIFVKNIPIHALFSDASGCWMNKAPATYELREERDPPYFYCPYCMGGVWAPHNCPNKPK